MKRIFTIIYLGLLIINLNAQESLTIDDFGRITLNVFVSEQAKLSIEAKSQLEVKLKQIASNYDMAGSGTNQRFIITANISVTSKDIIAGPPQKISQKMDITLFIGDAVDNKIFANTVISTSGVGTNENKAFIDAINQINTKNKTIEAFIQEGKSKIIAYYNTQCELIIQKTASLKQQEKYNEAMYVLAQVPNICNECYANSLTEMAVIYDLKINKDGNARLQEAKAIWLINPNVDGAIQAANQILQIKSQAQCYSEAQSLLQTINEKLTTDEKERLRKQEEIEKQQQALDAENTKQQVELDKLRINAYREVALEYAKNQPKEIYKNIYWR